jgi:hypothetical protein
VSSGVEEYGWLLFLSSWSLSKLKAAEVTRRFSALAQYSKSLSPLKRTMLLLN